MLKDLYSQLVNKIKRKDGDTLALTGNYNLQINGVTITITEDNDITIKGIRFLEVNSNICFFNNNSVSSNKLKKYILEHSQEDLVRLISKEVKKAMFKEKENASDR